MQNTGTLIYCQWEYINTMVQSLENSLIVPYSKYLPYIPKFPPLGVDPRKMKIYVPTKSHAHISFIHNSPILEITKCPSKGRGVKKL